uniref:Actin-associated protein FAM107A n=1 Tax=Sinocyclocheilus grahami TaxID=75366 RepID=A0A672QU61_SINGR
MFFFSFSIINPLYSTTIYFVVYSVFCIPPSLAHLLSFIFLFCSIIFRGIGVENKPELQRVLEERKREQIIKQKKQDEEARRKISQLEHELLKRHQKLDELEKEPARLEDSNCSAPEFIKVKENLRRTSFASSGEKEV